MSAGKKKRSEPPHRERARSLLEGRRLSAARQQLEALARKRSEELSTGIRKYFVHPPAFASQEVRSRADVPQRRLETVGEARQFGLLLSSSKAYRFRLQETLQAPEDTADSPIVGYSYQFLDSTGQEQIFRFEYHPDLAEGSRWGTIHHLHVNNLVTPDPRLGRLHFPVHPFLSIQDSPADVLVKVLDWSVAELR